MSCQRQNISMIRGVHKTFRLTVSDEDNEAVSLTGATVYFRVKESIDDATLKIEKDSNDVSEIEILDQGTNEGEADIKLLPADTSSLTPSIPHVYDVWVQLATGNRYAVVEPADFRVERAVTEL